MFVVASVVTGVACVIVSGVAFTFKCVTGVIVVPAVVFDLEKIERGGHACVSVVSSVLRMNEITNAILKSTDTQRNIPKVRTVLSPLGFALRRLWKTNEMLFC